MRRAGVNPWVLPTGDDAYGFLGRSFFWLVGAYLFILLTWILLPGWSARVFGALPLLMSPVPAWIGVGLLALGSVLVVFAQREMGIAWRVGIPEKDRPPLITSGPFRFSRNPVFLGMLVVGIGFTLVIPHAVSLAALATTYIALSVQIRLEEDYLRNWLGDDYVAYAEQVARWIGRSTLRLA
jgi:protein-S-isoprenylcysteine O-methyltransferase Ste14